MCNFFSLVITKHGVYECSNETHSHSEIIKKFNLQQFDLDLDLVKIEAVPKDYNTMSDFDIKVDQDTVPGWFNLEAERESILAAIKKYSLRELQLAAVKQDWYAIQFIKNKYKYLQLAAVKKNGYAIQFIKNQYKDVQIAAVTKNGHAIQYIENPDKDVQLEAVKKNGYAIRYIKNPDKDVQLAAVKQDGCAIRYIKNPDKDLQLAAVKQNGNAIQHIKNPDKDIQIEAIKQNAEVIKFIKNQSDEVLLEINNIKQELKNLNKFEYIKNEINSAFIGVGDNYVGK